MTYARYNKLRFDDLQVSLDNLLLGTPRTELLRDPAAGVLTLGSCFALELAGALRRLGRQAISWPIVESVNTPLFNRVLLQALVDGPGSQHFADMDAIHDGQLSSEAERIRQELARSQIAILTVGVGFLWRRKNGAVSLRPDPRCLDQYETFYPSTHEQARILMDIASLLRRLGPSHIFLTVSPIPAEMALDYPSPIIADCVSKSMLRSAVHEAMRSDQSLHYWPSFEFFRWISGHTSRAFFGQDGKVRHADRDLVEIVISKFLEWHGHREADPPDPDLRRSMA